MHRTTDVAIVGGGVIGSAIAYFLAAREDFGGRVTVFERDTTYADGSTARSVGSIRQQFSTPENIRMSLYGAEFLEAIDDYLSLGGEPVDVGYVRSAYLFLAGPQGMDVVRRNQQVQSDCGATVTVLDPAGLASRFPWLMTDDLGGGAVGEANEGWLDPYALMTAFRAKARALGVEYRDGEVTGVAVRSDRVEGLNLADGERIACGHLVNAAGPRAGSVAALAGIDLPVFPRKRIVYVFDCRTAVPDMPLTIDPTGVYCRPEGGVYLCGVSPPEDRDPDTLDLEIDYDLFEEVVWPVLARRVPVFEAIKLVRAWAGHYAYNTLDQNAVLGPHPEIGNFHFANGFSGHGLQQSPAVGRYLAELIATGRPQTLDLGRFGFERILANRPLKELSVV